MLGPLALVLVTAGAPEWSASEVRGLYDAAVSAIQQPNPQVRDEGVANAAGNAYKVPRRGGESVDGYARRVLKHRDPSHPEVRSGLWIAALAARFYEDLGRRATIVARFETERRARLGLEQAAKEALAAAASIAPDLEVKVEGLEGFIAPLPRAPGVEAALYGARAVVRGMTISIEDMDRATFEGDAPRASAERTGTGALRDLYSAFKQFDLHSEMFARVEPQKKKDVGKVRVFVPAARTGGYFNEIARAAQEAKYRELYLMVLGPQTGGLRTIPIALSKAPLPRAKKKEGWVEVRCREDEGMQACVDRIATFLGEGKPLLFSID